MGCQNVLSSVTLLASNFSRAGYGFAGWSDKFDYATNAEAHFYGPNETMSIPDTSIYTGEGKGLSLYAVWVKSQGNLQDSSKVATVCSSLTTAPIDGTANLASVSALTDQRDDQTYAIAKLADNKCWMIENLRLADKDTSNNDIELSGTNTNNPSLPITNVYDAANPTTSNHLSPSVDPTTTAWCTTNSRACDDQSMLNTDNYTNRASTPTTNIDTDMYSYGAYYNWYSATAGHGKYSTSTNNSNVAGDVCPTGWTLPIGGQNTVNTNNNFYVLAKTLMGGTEPNQNNSSGYGYYDNTPVNTSGDTATKAIRKYPNNFLYSGGVHGSSVYYRGSHGYYWSKSACRNAYVYSLAFYSSIVYPSNLDYSDKNYGFSVRCLAQ